MSIFSNPFGKKKQPAIKKAVVKPSVTKATKKPVVKKTVSRGGKSRGK